jgi:hypothetical protein
MTSHRADGALNRGGEIMIKRIIACVCAGYILQAGIGLIVGVAWAFATHPIRLQPFLDFVWR